jgi:hypothetical protein
MRIPTEGDSRALLSEITISEDTEGTGGHLAYGYPHRVYVTYFSMVYPLRFFVFSIKIISPKFKYPNLPLGIRIKRFKRGRLCH